jgi:hypothetical protein
MKTSAFAFFFSFCVLLSLPTFAQKVGVGLKLGGNSVSRDFDYKNATTLSFIGFNVGGYGYFKFNKFLALQAELNYIEYGMNLVYSLQWTDGNGNVSPEFENKITERYAYLQIPLLFRGQVDVKKFKFWGNAGLYAGMFLGGKYNITYELPPNIILSGTLNPTSGNLPDRTPIEWGLGAGLGVGYKLGIGYLTLDTRYLHGLSGIYESATITYAKIQHRNFVGNLGYLIEF